MADAVCDCCDGGDKDGESCMVQLATNGEGGLPLNPRQLGWEDVQRR